MIAFAFFRAFNFELEALTVLLAASTIRATTALCMPPERLSIRQDNRLNATLFAFNKIRVAIQEILPLLTINHISTVHTSAMLIAEASRSDAVTVEFETSRFLAVTRSLGPFFLGRLGLGSYSLLFPVLFRFGF